LVGAYAGRVLEGDKPADLPVQQSTKVELFLNLRITVPLPLSGRADEDRMISIPFHPSPSRAASSVPRWLTICLQWLLFQQMHDHGSESRVTAIRTTHLCQCISNARF